MLQFQKDAEELETQEADCDLEKLEKCIEYGDSICIELPQLTRLKQVCENLVQFNKNNYFAHPHLI